MSYFRLSDMECQHCGGTCEFWDVTGPYCVTHWNERNERVRIEMEIKRDTHPHGSVREAFRQLAKAAGGRWDDVDPDEFVGDLRGEVDNG